MSVHVCYGGLWVLLVTSSHEPLLFWGSGWAAITGTAWGLYPERGDHG